MWNPAWPSQNRPVWQGGGGGAGNTPPPTIHTPWEYTLSRINQINRSINKYLKKAHRPEKNLA